MALTRSRGMGKAQPITAAAPRPASSTAAPRSARKSNSKLSAIQRREGAVAGASVGSSRPAKRKDAAAAAEVTAPPADAANPEPSTPGGGAVTAVTAITAATAAVSNGEPQQKKPRKVVRQAAAAAAAAEGDKTVAGNGKNRGKKKAGVGSPGRVPSLVDLVGARVKAERIGRMLDELYGLNPPIPLDHATPFQLLVSVMLSAQTTDKKVNEVTPGLFLAAPDAASMAVLDPVSAILPLIRELGLAPTKSKNLAKMAQMLVELHGGEVPGSFQELEALPGVGHKTASVVMAQAFKHPAFPVDTHIHRLAQRWGLTQGSSGNSSVDQTEADLKAVFPEDTWNRRHLQIIYFGREHCPAQRHDPTSCPMCSWAAVPPYDRPGASPLKPGGKPGGR